MPLEPLATQLGRTNEKYHSAIDPMYAYAHATLDDETLNPAGFSSADKFLLSLENFVVLKDFLIFSNKRSSFFQRFDPSRICASLY